jgi:hypothetical protein
MSPRFALVCLIGCGGNDTKATPTSECEAALTHAVVLVQKQYSAGFRTLCDSTDEATLRCMIDAKIEISMTPQARDSFKDGLCTRALARANALIVETLGPNEAMLRGCEKGGSAFTSCLRSVTAINDLMGCIPPDAKP